MHETTDSVLTFAVTDTSKNSFRNIVILKYKKLVFLQNASTQKSMNKNQEGENEAYFLSTLQIQI